MSKADLGYSTVTVQHDPSKVTIDKIKEAVSVGYKFVGERPTNGHRGGSDEAIS